jgi:hypothetical protein
MVLPRVCIAGGLCSAVPAQMSVVRCPARHDAPHIPAPAGIAAPARPGIMDRPSTRPSAPKILKGHPLPLVRPKAGHDGRSPPPVRRPRARQPRAELLDLQPETRRVSRRPGGLTVTDRRRSHDDHLLRGADPRQRVVGQLAAAQLRRAGGSAVKLVREENEHQHNAELRLRVAGCRLPLHCRLPMACLSTHLCR